MSLKRLYVIVILGCFAQHLPAAQTGIPLNGVKWAAIQIFCEAHQKPSICAFVREFSEIEVEFNQVSHLLKDLESKLMESYTSEAIPYIEESCLQNQIPPFMIHVCEAVQKIIVLEKELEGLSRNDGRAAKQASWNNVEKAKKESFIIIQVTMEAACDLEQASETFCDSLNAVKAQKKVLYLIKAKLNSYKQVSEQDVQFLCDESIENTSNYYIAICGD